MSGFYLMHRDWQNNTVFGNEEYSSRDAWVWLVENAAWKPTRARVKGEAIELGRGELCFAQRFMAEKWGWSKSRVDRFLKRLCAENMISIRSKIGATAGQGSGQGQSIITICNYAEYQDFSDAQRGNEKLQTGPTAGQQRGKEEQGNKGTIECSEAKASSQRAKFVFACPDGVDPVDWQALMENRKAKRAANTEGAHRQIIKKLEVWARDGWPPGPIVANAVERGWTTVFETDAMKDRKNGASKTPDGRSMGRTEAAARNVLTRLGIDPDGGGESPPSPGIASDYRGRTVALPNPMRPQRFNAG